MSISGLSLSSKAAAMQQLFQQRRQDLASLESAVQAGNITSAQQSPTALDQDTSTIQSALNPSSSQSPGSQGSDAFPRSAFASDLTALVQAVQSGDVTTAQQDAAAIENDLQTSGSQLASAPMSGHHRRHHMAQGADSTADASNLTSSNAPNGMISTLPSAASGTSPNNTLALVLDFYNANS